jgi:hypothetical protein
MEEKALEHSRELKLHIRDVQAGKALNLLKQEAARKLVDDIQNELQAFKRSAEIAAHAEVVMRVSMMLVLNEKRASMSATDYAEHERLLLAGDAEFGRLLLAGKSE